MTEPKTEAGRTLLTKIKPHIYGTNTTTWDIDVLAIEAEATQAAEAQVRELREALQVKSSAYHTIYLQEQGSKHFGKDWSICDAPTCNHDRLTIQMSRLTRDAASHDAQGSVARCICNMDDCLICNQEPHAQGSVAREGEPKTEAGRALLDRLERAGLIQVRDTILAIEAKAVKPWREAFEKAARDRHALSYVTEARTKFEDCAKPDCVQARALLDESDTEPIFRRAGPSGIEPE